MSLSRCVASALRTRHVLQRTLLPATACAGGVYKVHFVDYTEYYDNSHVAFNLFTTYSVLQEVSN